MAEILIITNNISKKETQEILIMARNMRAQRRRSGAEEMRYAISGADGIVNASMLELVESWNALDDRGRERVREWADDLVCTGKYLREDGRRGAEGR